jgi:phage terminase large subunit-like protein
MSSSWSTACPNWEQRITERQSLVPDLPLFGDEADKALRIFKRLMIPDVIGTPTMAEAAGEWFFPIVAAIFGSFDAAANRRMIQEFFLLVPKKNDKSSYAAAIMVVAIIMNRRPDAEFLLIAPTKEVADIAYKQATGIIRLDPELTKLFHIQRNHRAITHRETGARVQIKAADTDTITGSKSTGILVDETHVFAKKANAAEVFVEIRGAMAARPDGFMVQISTQSKSAPSGVFASELGTARAVRDGSLKLPLLPVLYELPERIAKDGGWKDPKTWPMVNPNLGLSVDEEFLARIAQG